MSMRRKSQIQKNVVLEVNQGVKKVPWEKKKLLSETKGSPKCVISYYSKRRYPMCWAVCHTLMKGEQLINVKQLLGATEL